MKPHVLLVEEEVEVFRPLIEAACEAGERVGWLDLRPPGPVDPSLESAVAIGALRAVAVGGGRSCALKTLTGPAVLSDLVGEHFKGCRLVLVREAEAEVDALRGLGKLPRLRPRGEGWEIRTEEGSGRALDTELLVRSLRRAALG